MKPENLARSQDLLLASSRPFLVTHIAPDGDALGSLLGLGWALRKLGKEPAVVCQGPLPSRFDFLPGFGEVTSRPRGRFDLLVSLDCSDPGRMGEVGTYPGVSGVPVLNVDHHLTNLEYGTVNLVDVDAVSTTEVLYRLLRFMEVELDERIATCLLTGLVTDTRGFRTSNVTPEVLRVAMDLMEAGAPLPMIARNGLDRRPLEVLRLWGAAFSRIRVEDGVIWTSLPLSAQKAIGYNGYGDAGLANMLVSVEGAQAAVVFTEREDGQVEVGFRAIPGFDVAEVALSFGGGGHALASGCLLPGPLEEVQRRVLKVLRESLARQRERISSSDGRHPQPE